MTGALTTTVVMAAARVELSTAERAEPDSELAHVVRADGFKAAAQKQEQYTV